MLVAPCLIVGLYVFVQFSQYSSVHLLEQYKLEACWNLVLLLSQELIDDFFLRLRKIPILVKFPLTLLEH